MTDSNSGLNVIEQRFQRRNRSVRPPRRPRAQTENEEHDTTESRLTPASEESSQPEQAAAEPQQNELGVRDQQGEQTKPGAEAMEVDDAELSGGQQNDEDDRSRQQEGQSEQFEEQEYAQDQAVSGTLASALQQQIAAVLAPMAIDIKRQIVDAVQRQELARASEYVSRQAAPSQGDQGGRQRSEPQQEELVDAPLLAAIGWTSKGLRRALQWLVKTLVAIPRAISAAVARLVRWVGHALAAVVSGLWHFVRSFLVELLKKTVLAMLRAMLRHLTSDLEVDHGAAKESHEEQGKAA